MGQSDREGASLLAASGLRCLCVGLSAAELIIVGFGWAWCGDPSPMKATSTHTPCCLPQLFISLAVVCLEVNIPESMKPVCLPLKRPVTIYIQRQQRAGPAASVDWGSESEVGLFKEL